MSDDLVKFLRDDVTGYIASWEGEFACDYADRAQAEADCANAIQAAARLEALTAEVEALAEQVKRARSDALEEAAQYHEAQRAKEIQEAKRYRDDYNAGDDDGSYGQSLAAALQHGESAEALRALAQQEGAKG